MLGHYKPEIYSLLFPHTGPVALVLDGVTAISVVFFLLTAGIEIDLSSIFRQGKSALLVSLLGMVVPFVFGLLSAGAFPRLLGIDEGTDRLVFALFMGTVMGVVQVTVQAVSGPLLLGTGAAMVQFSRSVGAAFGTAIVTAVLFAALSVRSPEAARAFTTMVEHGGASALAPGQLTAVQGDIAEAFRAAFLSIAGFTGLGILLAMSIPLRRI